MVTDRGTGRNRGPDDGSRSGPIRSDVRLRGSGPRGSGPKGFGPSGFSRRGVLCAAAALAGIAGWAGIAGAVGPGAAPRVAAIDWAMAETAMAIGVTPVALAERIAFRRSTPLPLPDSTVDLGLRGAPNLEALSLVAPEMILSSSYYAFADAALSRIAPVFSRALYVPGEPPFPKLMALLPELAQRMGIAAAGHAARDHALQEFAALSARVAPHAARPCLIVEIGDSRHVRIFGTDSLFGGTLSAMGLRNGWDRETRFAFAAPLPIARLVDFPDARMVIMGDVPRAAERALARGALWNSLGPVRAGRVHRLGEINGFGGIASARVFARALTAALEQAA